MYNYKYILTGFVITASLSLNTYLLYRINNMECNDSCKSNNLFTNETISNSSNSSNYTNAYTYTLSQNKDTKEKHERNDNQKECNNQNNYEEVNKDEFKKDENLSLFSSIKKLLKKKKSKKIDNRRTDKLLTIIKD